MLTAALCLAANIYHEARGEPISGQLMVAQVTINRVQSERYPDTVCGVVYDHKQFSWTEVMPSVRNPKAATQAVMLAFDVLANRDILPGSEATHYHADTVMPYWVDSMVELGKVGSHVFYLEE